MKITKKQLAISLIAILITLASFTIMLLDFLIPLKIWVHPILTFLLCMCSGFGVMSIVLAFIKKSPWYFFLSAVLLGLSVIYVMLQFLPWWIGVAGVGVLLIIIAIICFIVTNNKTDSIALNNSPEYKNYEQRKQEKIEQEKEQATEELSKIKSFK